MLDLQGCIVTIDAIGCQREITQGGTGYVLAVKESQGQLYEGIRDLFKGALPHRNRYPTKVVAASRMLPKIGMHPWWRSLERRIPPNVPTLEVFRAKSAEISL